MKPDKAYYINTEGIADRSKQKEEIKEYVKCEICGNGFTSHYRKVKAHYSDDNFNIEICNSCGLIYVNPRLDSEFRNFCYEKEGHLVDFFLQKKEKGYYLANLILDVIEKMCCCKGNLLDIGCGIGTLLDVASERGFRTTGIELNEKTALYTANRHQVIKNDIFNSELSDSFFDVVVLEQTLEHLSEPLKALVKIKELLKPGGYIFIGVPEVDWLVLLLNNKNIPWVTSNSLWSPEDHLYYFLPSTMQKLIEKAGFKNIDISKTMLKWRIKKLFGLSYGRFLARKDY